MIYAPLMWVLVSCSKEIGLCGNVLSEDTYVGLSSSKPSQAAYNAIRDISRLSENAEFMKQVVVNYNMARMMETASYYSKTNMALFLAISIGKRPTGLNILNCPLFKQWAAADQVSNKLEAYSKTSIAHPLAGIIDILGSDGNSPPETLILVNFTHDYQNNNLLVSSITSMQKSRREFGNRALLSALFMQMLLKRIPIGISRSNCWFFQQWLKLDKKKEINWQAKFIQETQNVSQYPLSLQIYSILQTSLHNPEELAILQRTILKSKSVFARNMLMSYKIEPIRYYSITSIVLAMQSTLGSIPLELNANNCPIFQQWTDFGYHVAKDSDPKRVARNLFPLFMKIQDRFEGIYEALLKESQLGLELLIRFIAEYHIQNTLMIPSFEKIYNHNMMTYGHFPPVLAALFMQATVGDVLDTLKSERCYFSTEWKYLKGNQNYAEAMRLFLRDSYADHYLGGKDFNSYAPTLNLKADDIYDSDLHDFMEYFFPRDHTFTPQTGDGLVDIFHGISDQDLKAFIDDWSNSREQPLSDSDDDSYEDLEPFMEDWGDKSEVAKMDSLVSKSVELSGNYQFIQAFKDFRLLGSLDDSKKNGLLYQATLGDYVEGKYPSSSVEWEKLKGESQVHARHAFILGMQEQARQRSDLLTTKVKSREEIQGSGGDLVFKNKRTKL